VLCASRQFKAGLGAPEEQFAKCVSFATYPHAPQSERSTNNRLAYRAPAYRGWGGIRMGKYSETLTEHVLAPRNGGVIQKADLTGHAGVPGRGAFMILFLKLKEDRISEAKYHTVGCGPTIASGSMLTEMIVGRTIAECGELTTEKLIEALDGVPPDKLHCPALAIGALRDALSRVGTKSETAPRSEILNPKL
jgi:nitrogen fixation NifU-like protein